MLFFKNISVNHGLLARGNAIRAEDARKEQAKQLFKDEIEKKEPLIFNQLWGEEKSRAGGKKPKNAIWGISAVASILLSVFLLALKFIYPAGASVSQKNIPQENSLNSMLQPDYSPETIMKETRQSVYSAVSMHTPRRAYIIIVSNVRMSIDMLSNFPENEAALRELENYLADAEKLLNSDLSEFGQVVDYSRIKTFIQSYKNSGLTESEVETVLACGALYCRINDLDPYLFFAMLAKESSFRRTVVSSAGAVGLGQIMPVNYSALGITDANNIQQNLRASALHLKGMLNLWSAYSPQQQLELALASYHSGRANILRSAISKNGVFAFNKLTPRTQRYIRDIFANANELRKPKPE